MNAKKIIVAGIGTDTGKTVISAILCEALKADYWKPVQAGDLNNTDSHKIASWTSSTTIHHEAHRLNTPMSPHAAAEIDNILIKAEDLLIPATNNRLIIELAGGLLVPLTKNFMNANWVQATGLPIVLVCNYYLGSINHTLLSLEFIKQRKLPLLGLIFNGEKNQSTFDVIMHQTNAPCLLEVPQEEEINEAVIRKHANRIKL